MPAWIYKDAAKPAQPEETIDDVKQAYALLFKAHGAVASERDALKRAVDALIEYDEYSDTGGIGMMALYADAINLARAALNASKEQP